MSPVLDRLPEEDLFGELPFDPVEADAEPFMGRSYSINAELMRWLSQAILEGKIELRYSSMQLFSNLGCDMTHITAGVNQVDDRRETGNIKGELVDYFICVSHGCATNASTIYRKDGKLHLWGTIEYDAEDADFILICRESHHNGHGCKWYEISYEDLKWILDAKYPNAERH